ncbi:MAG: hypothetical protein ABIZ56_01440 [Chthoniobacteraceae bacterium]
MLAEVRVWEPQRRVILFGSAALLVSLEGMAEEEFGFETTLDADLLLVPDDDAVRRKLDAELGSGSAYDASTGHHGDFVDFRISRDFFPMGWQTRLVVMKGFAGVFALSIADNAAAKLLATASARLNRRMGGDAADRGLKDIRSIASLLRAGLLTEAELNGRLDSVGASRALMVEADGVLRETIAVARE